MIELGPVDWAMLGLCAFLSGLTKSGIPGLGTLTVSVMAMILPALRSTGILLPMLILSDTFAMIVYRKSVVWTHLARLLPWTFLGILIGFGIMRGARDWDDTTFKAVVGGIVLIMLVLDYWRKRKSEDDLHIPSHWTFAAVLGITAGITTMMANAAGAIVIIYLLAMQLPKTQFVGTRAWFFFIVNCLKVPFSTSMGLINRETLTLNLTVAPLIIVGGLCGVALVKKIRQKLFAQIVQALAALAAIRLVLSALG